MYSTGDVSCGVYFFATSIWQWMLARMPQRHLVASAAVHIDIELKDEFDIFKNHSTTETESNLRTI